MKEIHSNVFFFKQRITTYFEQWSLKGEGGRDWKVIILVEIVVSGEQRDIYQYRIFKFTLFKQSIIIIILLVRFQLAFYSFLRIFFQDQLFHSTQRRLMLRGERGTFPRKFGGRPLPWKQERKKRVDAFQSFNLNARNY